MNIPAVVPFVRTENGKSVNVIQHILVSCKADVWHNRLCHPSPKVINQFVPLCNGSIKSNESLSFCEACKLGKSHRLPFTLSDSRALS